MNWEHVLSNAGTGEAAQTAEPAMDSETFAGFSNARRVHCGLTWRGFQGMLRWRKT